MLLRRLTYLSRVHHQFRNLDLQQICGAAAVLHRRHDLSGIFAFTGAHFVQVIEGSPDAVGHLMDLIEADPRHGDIRVLCDEPADRRLFDHWEPILVDSLDVIDEVELALSTGGGCDCARYLTERILRSRPGAPT